jgi:hypothetical protein
MRNAHRAHVARSHRGRVMIACAALWLALIGTTTAAADLAPPSTAPPVTKRKCAGYSVVAGHGALAAHCKAYTTETLRSLNQRQGTTTHAGESVAPHPAASNHAGASAGPPPGAGSPGGGSRSPRSARPAGGPAAIGAHTSASLKSASSDSPLALLAIIAASALAGGVALALMRSPNIRRRKRDARGPAF